MARRRGLRSQVGDLVRWAEDNGWTIEHTSGGHLRYTHPDATGPIFGASSPSDHRATKNMKARLRRALRADCRTPMRD